MLTKGLRHPDPDTRECAAAAIGNLAAGNASFSNVDGEKMVIVNLLEAAVQPLMTLCKANSSGPEEDCAGEFNLNFCYSILRLTLYSLYTLCLNSVS